MYATIFSGWKKKMKKRENRSYLGSRLRKIKPRNMCKPFHWANITIFLSVKVYKSCGFCGCFSLY